MLTQRMQVQSLADRLVGLPTSLDPTNLTDPWRSCWLALDQSLPGQEHLALLDALKDLSDRELIMGLIFSALPGATLGSYPSLLELAKTLQTVEWLWPGWIPRGMITLLGAVPGAGKSFLALDLARRLIHGLPFPSALPSPSHGEGSVGEVVIYVDAESIPQLINQRAQAWQMDTSRLYLMLPHPTGDPLDMLDFARQQHRDRLVEMVFTLHPQLVIIDSLSSITCKGENNIEDVRAVLGFLNLLAQDFKIGLLLIHHLRKAAGFQTKQWDISIDDFRGSSHIIAMSRSVMGLSVVQTGPEPDRNGPRKLEIIKTNLGPYPDPLGFEFAPLHPAGVLLRWGSAPRSYEEPTSQDKCSAWLADLLSNASEPLRPSEIIELGESEGFSRASIYRARELLGSQIENTQGRKNRSNTWKWVGDESHESQESQELSHPPPQLF